jgi:hypothetical protein
MDAFNKQVYEIPRNTFSSLPSSFRRMGYAVKVGVGSSQNFIDLIYTKAWDEENYQNPNCRRYHSAENTTLGIVSQLTFSRKYRGRLTLV